MNYRKLYENKHGTIPSGFHIHHIDGNHSNNHIDNLQCVSAQEHYDIHYSQGDYGACWAMVTTGHLSISPEERAFISSQTQKDLSSKGKHPFQSEEVKEKTRIRNAERNKSLVGKTYEEIYGEEKSLEIRRSMSLATKGKPLNLTEEQLVKKSKYLKDNNPMHKISDEKNKERKEKIGKSVRERLADIGSNTKGKLCYTNGDRNIFVSPGDNVPEGFIRGMFRKAKI